MARDSNHANDIPPHPNRSTNDRRRRAFRSSWIFESPSEDEGSNFLAPFCTCHDMATCLRTHLCVYYSFSKLWWRIERIRKEKDPLDSNWDCRTDGCNGICWSTCALNTLLYGVPLPLMLMWKRNQIRKLYRIDGNIIYDIVLPIACCGSCVMMQLDREIRLREGDMALEQLLMKKAHSATDGEIVQLPPPVIEPMRYISPRVTSENVSNYSGEPPLSVQNRAPSRSRLAFLKPHKNRKIDVASPQVENRAAAPIRDVEVAPGLNHEHRHEEGYAQKANNGMEHSVVRPMLASSIAVIDAQPKNLALESRNLTAGGAGVDMAFAHVPSRPSAEDSLADSEARDIATSLRDKRSNVGLSGGQQLSYVHDFSDECPVNKSVLMYYEKEEDKSKENPSHGGTKNKLATNNPYQQLISSKDLARGGEQSRPTDGNASSSRPLGSTVTASSVYGESEHQLNASSSEPPKMRSSDQIESSPSADESDSHADKKATSL